MRVSLFGCIATLSFSLMDAYPALVFAGVITKWTWCNDSYIVDINAQSIHEPLDLVFLVNFEFFLSQFKT